MDHRGTNQGAGGRGPAFSHWAGLAPAGTRQLPGALSSYEIGDVSSHHDAAVLTWLVIQANGQEFARGIDQITVDRTGQISKITTFAPSEKNLA
jgi:hypothetical protein